MSVYESIMRGLNEAVEYEKNGKGAKTVTLTVAPLPEIKRSEIRDIRMSLNMTQGVFASVMGVSVKTVEAWEAGRNVPSGTARRMLAMLRSDPQLPEKYNIFSVR